MQYYIYRHVRCDTNTPFYIGIGKKPDQKKIKGFNSEYSRAFEKTKRSEYWKNIINKTSYKVEILLESDDKDIITNLEMYFIKLYGRKCCDANGTLVNFSEGGELNNGPKQRYVSITQLSLQDEVIKVWDELKYIEKELGYLKTNIIKCCRKKQLTAYGYKWKYTNDTTYDNVYPSTARVKKSNNRSGIILIHKKLKTNMMFRTRSEVSTFLNCDITTVSRYLKKGYNKEYTFEYRKWN